MVRLRNLSKTHYSSGARKIVCEDVNAIFPARTCVALLGRNGAGKSTLLKMIAGTVLPDSGEVERHGTVSWPVGFAGSFHGELSGAQNIRFIARVYGVDTEELVSFVEDFAELGSHFHLPVRTYSSGMRARLGFGLSLGIHFDTYLVDENTAVGDAAFRDKSTRFIQDRLRKSSAIVVSHGLKLLQELCTEGAVLEAGRLYYYRDLDEAIAHHRHNLRSEGNELEEDFV